MKKLYVLKDYRTLRDEFFENDVYRFLYDRNDIIFGIELKLYSRSYEIIRDFEFGHVYYDIPNTIFRTDDYENIEFINKLFNIINIGE